MIDLEEALARLEAATSPLGDEEIDASRALGRMLAEEIAADRDMPPADRSAMDGFAVRAADLAAPGATLRVVGEVRAGQAPEVSLGAGETTRIYTGAVLPEGADAVVMVERTREDRAAGSVRIDVAVAPGDHVRPRGQDRRVGETVLRPGVPVGPPEIAALATVGRERLRVGRLPRVAVLSTGDEVVAGDATPGPHQIRNSNAPMLLALLAESGIAGADLGNAPDESEGLGRLVERGLDFDLLLLTGGVSVGEYDLVAAALETAGAETLFHGVAIKPGKPILAARRRGTIVLGLPGNPVSACAGFTLFVAPALRLMQGAHRWRAPELPATLAEPIRRRPGRRTYHLARIEAGGAGLSVRPVASTGSGDVLSLCRANGFVVTPLDCTGLEAGAPVACVPWPGAWLRA